MITALPQNQHDAAVQLWHDTGLTRPWNDPGQDLENAMSGLSSTVLAAVVDDELRGTVMVGVDGHRGWMYYLAVAPDAQGTGLGRALVAAAEAWVAAHAITKLMLMVRTTNTQVLSFYAALGYEVNEVQTLGKRF